MSERDFVYWLKGFFEMTNAKTLSEDQVKMVREHLQKVGIHITFPSLSRGVLDSSPLIHRGPPSISDTIIC